MFVVFEATDEWNPFSIKYVASRDGGKTWGSRTLIYAPANSNKLAAAPFVIQTSNGDIVVSLQTDENGTEDSTQNVDMKTVVSTDNGKTWGTATVPFPVDINHGDSAMWNSLFVLDAHTIMAASSVNQGRFSGIELVTGHIR